MNEAMKATAKVFAKQGFDDEDNLLEELAKACQLSQAVMCPYFSSKIQLFCQVIDYWPSICQTFVFQPLAKSFMMQVKPA